MRSLLETQFIAYLRGTFARSRWALARSQTEVAKQLAKRNTILAADLGRARQTIQHLRRLEGDYVAARDKLASLESLLQAAQRGVRAFINELQLRLFEIRGNTKPSEAASAQVLADQAAGDSLATLIKVSSEIAEGARPFQYVVPFLANLRPFPLPWPASLPPLRVVDVGSQELDLGGDMHTPLRSAAPVEVIGFDPLARTPKAKAGSVKSFTEVTRRDGGRIKTFPFLIADGSEVTFRVNRFDATSSILQGNHHLAKQFGLLDACLETVETRVMRSYRLDDVLPTSGEQARVDLLKIDVQGATHKVLANASKVLANTLICHVEVEFAPVYLDERLFGDIDILLREAGFCFVDFFSLGRQRYDRFDRSPERALHRGRTLWADCIYIRGLDTDGALSADDLFRAALIAHSCYNKQDLAAELLGRSDAVTGTNSLKIYIDATPAAGRRA